MSDINIKNKIFIAIIIFFLILSNLNFSYIKALKINEEIKNNVIFEVSEIKDNISFSEPYNETWGDYIYMKVDEAKYFMRDYGKPMLPVFKKVYTFPLGSKIQNVECVPSNISNEYISGVIKPASNIFYISAINGTVFKNNTSKDEIIIVNETIYSSSNLFTDRWYDYSIKCGMENNENVVFLLVNIYPVRYSPSENQIFYAKDVDIKIIYEEPIKVKDNSDKYDMMIITPKKFIRTLKPFINHKNKYGISIIVKSTEEIFNGFQGRDRPEQLKYFIKYAKEEWDVTYVLLVGGLKKTLFANDKDGKTHGSKDWYIPVRYTSLEEGCIGQGSISDLYYADIYKYNQSFGYAFEDWDSNKNNIFAEGNSNYLEEIDLCPDVYLGRIPCRNKHDLRIVIKKIKKYESTSQEDKPWYKKMISISGNSGTITGGKPECEVYSEKSVEYMDEIVNDVVKIYASNRDTNGLVPNAKTITKEITKGAGFVHFLGHGGTLAWMTLWPDCEYSSENISGRFLIYDSWRIFNGNKLPVAVVSGCATSLFNVTLIKSITSSRFGNKDYYITNGYPTSKCMCWKLLSKPNGGAIATIGCTATESMNSSSPYIPRGFSLNSELDYDFFYCIGKKDITIFGQAFNGAITKSVLENPIRSYEAHCIMQWQCFADPSLKLGGYN